LGLWKSTVLPHYLQNLRYIQSTTGVKKLQISLNVSLAHALHVYGDHTALLADTGVPPLSLIQYTHLAQTHFRLTKTRSDTPPAILYKTFNQSLALSNLHPSTLDYHIRNTLHQLHIDPVMKPLPHMATLPHKSRERAYRDDPQAWHRFRYALEHHLLKHRSSPYNEAAAQKLSVRLAVRALLHKVEHPILPVDPLFHETITTQELAAEIKKTESRQIPRR